jgi:hypothetical protein
MLAGSTHVHAPGSEPPGGKPSAPEASIRPPGRVGLSPSRLPAVPAGSGEPLRPDVRAALELEQGRRFSDVRVHRGAEADAATRELGAVAFASGRDVVFRSGAYDPATTRGKLLLAHELAHVSQQTSGPLPEAGRLSSPGDPWERAADETARGRRVLRPGGAAPALQRDVRHDKGLGGEQSMGFSQYRWEDGWAVLRGPSGAGGHGITAGGEDGLFYNVRTSILRIADNKAFSRAGNVGSATAIDPTRNLLQNLDDMIADVEAMGSSADLPIRQDVLRLLRQTRAAVRDGTPLPGRVQLVVHNELGASTGVSERLAGQGVRFIDGRVPVVPPEGTARPSLGLRTASDAPPVADVAAGEAVALPTIEAMAAEAAPGLEAAARIGSIGRTIAAFALETLFFVALSLGLEYLEQRRAKSLVREAMQAAEPNIRSAISDSEGTITRLQADAKRPTVWANVTFRMKYVQTLDTAWGTGGAHMMMMEAGLVGVALTTTYRDVHSETELSRHDTLTQYGNIQSATIADDITYSLPIPYDPWSLDAGGRDQRIASNEADAFRKDLPPSVVQALWHERDELYRVKTALAPQADAPAQP